ncbi:glutathione peroxidase [Phytophthora sojae]|uniref:Glutathione peroxidase n=1 Tax=Phytophthora sojae (strain P6497) TaxID=1094619 RepID=G4ZXN9_PHYSP|nr:glutathione peroxidase [Phytophthora sojae]EGZ12602.1 glutathione peroxidase [Phytophthora sojae]|eukprot:XP_009532935.1 glutathione peroxidase [Phytophthora sojae]
MSAAQTMITLARSARETERVERDRLEREPSFVSARSPSSAVDASPSPPDADGSCWSSETALDGRVFRRLQRFHLLPSELKAQSDMVATYLLAPRVRRKVLEQRKHWWQHPLHLSKAGLGTFVQGRELLKAILGYLLLSHAANNSLRDAQQLAEGLVLSGFLSPVHEAREADDEPLGELYVSDDEYYELVAPGATAIPARQTRTALSVWAVTDGATRAGFSCYAVVNKTKHHSLVLFETDVARHELVRILSLKSKPEQEQWLLALLDAGAAFLETHPAILSFASSTASLYSLRDTDANGKPFCLSELRGHVALLVNVTSGSCNTNAEQLLELADLSKKYEDAGLKVVAFPSAQFGDAEFDNDEELVEHFQELFGVRFPVLTTRDVNGPNARDALLFCKTRVPGAARSAANAFIENNFVKFLVDREGRLVKRFGPNDLPLSMETDIQELL